MSFSRHSIQLRSSTAPPKAKYEITSRRWTTDQGSICPKSSGGPSPPLPSFSLFRPPDKNFQSPVWGSSSTSGGGVKPPNPLTYRTLLHTGIHHYTVDIHTAPVSLPVTLSPANRWKLLIASSNCLSGSSRNSCIIGSGLESPRWANRLRYTCQHKTVRN